MDPRSPTGELEPSPSDHTTLTEVLAQFADGGFVGDFGVMDTSGAVRCHTCQEETKASEIEQHTIRRLEGASDPDDMVAVVAITCPRCSARGTLILPFGPVASAAEAAVLAEMRDSRGDGAAPRNSAPGETVGDHGADDDAPPVAAPA